MVRQRIGVAVWVLAIVGVRLTGAAVRICCRCHMMQWYHVTAVGVTAKGGGPLPTCYAWNHVVLAPLFFVPSYLIPMAPPTNAMTWSLSTYWRAHRWLGLRLYQVNAERVAGGEGCHGFLPIVS